MPEYEVNINFVVNRKGQGFEQLSRDLKKIEQNTAQTAKKSGLHWTELKSQIDIVAGGVQKAAQLIGQAFDFAAEGRQLQNLEDRFRTLTDTIGGYENVLADLKTTTLGQVSNTDLMAAAQGLLQGEIVSSNEELQKHFEVVSKLKKPHEDFGSALENWTLLMANQSILRLDTYGISASQVKLRMAELAKEQGSLTKEQRFNIATMEVAEKVMERLGDAVPIDEFAVFTTTLKDNSDEMKKNVAGGVEPYIAALNRLTAANIEEGEARGVIFKAFKQGRISFREWIGTTGAANTALLELIDSEDLLNLALKARNAQMIGMRPNQAEMSEFIEEQGEAISEAEEKALEWIETLTKLTEEQGNLNRALSELTPIWNDVGLKADFLAANYRDVVEEGEKVAASMAAQREAAEAGSVSLQDRLEINLKLIEADREAAIATGDLFASMLNADEGTSFFNESLDSLGEQLIMVGGRTQEQNVLLKEAQGEYDKLGNNIAKAAVAPELFGLEQDKLNEKVGEWIDRQRELEPLIGRLSGVTGEYVTKNIEATINQENLNKALFEAADAAGASGPQLAALGAIMGTLSDEEANAALNAALIQGKIEELAAGFVAGTLSVQGARTQLKGFITDLDSMAAPLEEAEADFGEAQGALQRFLDRGTDLPKVEFTSNIDDVKEDVSGLQDVLFRVQARGEEGGTTIDPYEVGFNTNASDIAFEVMDPLQVALDAARDGTPYVADLDTNAPEKEEEVDAFQRAVDALHGKTITITTKYVTEGSPPSGVGGAHGLDFVVPPGFPGDSFGPIFATSGERVLIETTAQQAGGGGRFGGLGGGDVYNVYAQTEAAMALVLAQVHNNKRQRMGRSMGG